MDDRKLRCGRAAVHIKFGEDVAMLAAVALLSHALDIVSCVDGVPPDTRMRLMSVLAQAVAVHGSARSQYPRGTQDKPLIAIATTDALSTDNRFGVVIGMAAIVTQTSVETT